MARVSKTWRLDIYVRPTPSPPPPEQVVEAMYALGLELRAAEVEQVVASPLGGVLVAIVKHLARQGGYQVVETDGPSLLDEGGVAAGDPSAGGPTYADVSEDATGEG